MRGLQNRLIGAVLVVGGVLAGCGCPAVRDWFPDISAIKCVQSLDAAEVVFFEKHGRCGGLNELQLDNSIKVQVSRTATASHPYRYAIEVKQGGYLIRAWPGRVYGKARLRSFCVDESHVIREYTTAGPPGCGRGGSPVK